MYGKLSVLASLFAAATAQQVGTLTAETHPSLSYSTCTSGGSCSTVQGAVTIDANWRWLHSTSGSTNCYTGNTWNTTICSSASACASGCALDGADYSGTYGVSTSGNALTLGFVTQGPYCEPFANPTTYIPRSQSA
jgi:cellulose 1,4-beta-cellobiosidase